ncbi:BspA family leucine-rich repeat surface protein [Bifidobacterium sp. ESL0690]|uniref:BspA family leucine-rich repeat surface protein n=1 Tax=Bifidobacterium sp. ESL0690 TaxID=2983214 RepID=UPI0023F702F4|nr:BspA family leucine-rich repeat surface protein [Bifidobacterium sp. ESL0690]WEV46730.1 BspA family leucine-rich repeat surface protein [Bifidobacterium sp. ESL0690]
MHSHGNRTPPPQNEPSLNNPVNSGTAASSQTAASNSSVAPTSTSVSASSSIQTNGSPASSSTTLSTSTTTAPTGNAASQTPGTTNIQASNKPVQPSNANQSKNASQTQGSAQPTKQLRNTKNTALDTTKTGLTHTNAAATPTAKPKTLGTLAAKDFSDASKTLATFLQRMKSASHTTGNNYRTTPAATLPHATATLPAAPSRVASPNLAYTGAPSPLLSRSAPRVSMRSGGGVRVTNWGISPDGKLSGYGFADRIDGEDTWVHMRLCPAGVDPGAGTNNIPAQCSDTEMLTDGHTGGVYDHDNFAWGGIYKQWGHTGPDGSDFTSGHGDYIVYVYTQTWGGLKTSDPYTDDCYTNYFGARTYVTITYNMTDMTGASKPADQRVETTNGEGSITLAGEPSHPSWQIFDGWWLDYWSAYDAGHTLTYPQRTDATHTATPHWHTRTTKVTFNYNLNGMPGGTPGSQEINTTNNGGSIALQNPPSHPDWQVFDGWTVDGWNNMNAGQTYSVNVHDEGTHTVTARWHVRPDTVTINYNANGSGCSMPGQQTADSANYSSLTLAGTPSCPAHIRFDGWTINYNNYSAYSTFNFTQHATATYTATARTHINYTTATLAYNLNGLPATQPGNQTADTTYAAASIPVNGAPSGIPAWAVFDGWYTNNSGTGTNYANASYPVGQQDAGTHTLYAKWHALPTNVTITYDMGTTGCAKPADQHPDSTGKTGTATTTLANTPATCPAHTHFDGWTINHTDYAPGATFTYPRHSTDTYTATARAHTITAPTGLAATYRHSDDKIVLTGTADVQSGDKVTACMTEGTGDTSCQPAVTATAASNAWQWTITFPTTDYTDRYGIGHSHHFTATRTSQGTDSAATDLKGTLPWMTVSFDKGDATGTAPGDKNALVDTSTNKASLTIPGQGSMNAPANSWFNGWKSGTVTWQPGPANIPTNTAGATTTDGHTTLTLTAQWHTVQAPTGLTAAYHITGTVTLTGTANVQSGDKVTACMTEGTGDTACQPAITATANNSGWNWTVTFPATDYTTRYGYGHQHHFTAKLTENNADSATTDLQGTLPWTTLSFDKGASGGTAPDAKDALTDTTANKATFTLPDKGTMTPPAHAFPDFTGWSDGTSLWQPGPRDIPTNTTGATTTNGHTTLTLTAQWHTVPAPTGVTARYSHAENRVYLTATGLQTGVTDWQIQVKPTTATSHYQSTSNTSTTGQSSYYASYFTPGATWTAQACATYTDGSGHSVTSDWSTEFTGVLPWMDVILKPGAGTGADNEAKSLVDTTAGMGYPTLPGATGMTAPAGTAFANLWTADPGGAGDGYMGTAAIPTSKGTPDGAATRVTLYAKWGPRTQTPASGACAAAGWRTWGTSAGRIAGIDSQGDLGDVCWTVEDSVLRLSGGTSPNDDYTDDDDIPWNTVKSSITKVSIEGDLTITGDVYNDCSLFGDMPQMTSFTNNHHPVTLDRNTGNLLFASDSKLERLDLSGWHTGTETNLRLAFSGLSKLKNLNLDGWDTGKITSMIRTFSGNPALTDLDVADLNTGNVEDMYLTFDGDTALTDLDLSGWDTGKTSRFGGWAGGMLPRGLQRLRLGPDTKLGDYAFGSISASTTWHEWDWPKGHHPSDLGLVGATAGTPGDGTLSTLKTRAASAHPAGVYIRADITPTWTDLTYNLNGGTGDTSLPTQIGAAATSATPKRDGLAIDTTFKVGTYTTATPTHITGNKPHQLFNGWTIDTGNVTGGAATVSNHTITAAKGAGGTATVTAQWTSTPQAMPGTPAVAVTPHTTDQGGVNVSVTANLDAAMPAIGATGNDPAKPAVSAGGTVKVCAKPSNQNDDFYPVQCTSKTSTTAGSQTITPDPFALPGSLTGGQATTFPAPGEAYTLAAMYTITDPQTRNQIDSTATQTGGGLVNGTLPWLNVAFDTNDSHGGTGTPPTGLKSFVDTASGKAWTTLPNATGTMKPDHFVFAGWTTTPANEQPDQDMNDPSNRNIQLPATVGVTETQTTLYAVWHKLATPTVTGITRDHMTNTVTVTGTATPWTSEDAITLDLTPLDGQTGLTPAGTRVVTISPTDQHGAMLAYDGHTEHPWTLTLTADELPRGGRYRTVAKLKAHDYQWRDTNADLHVYSEPDQQNQPAIDGYFHHALPLTGGQRTMLIIALTLLGVFLIGMSQLARNRRRWHHQ